MKIKKIALDGLFSDGDWIESKDQDPEGAIRLIQLADIGDGYFVDKSKRYVNTATATRLRCTYLKKGDLLIARMPDPIGRCCVFPLDGEEKYITSVDVCILRIVRECSVDYLKYAINSPLIRRRIEEQVTGTTRQRITRKKIGELEIPLPPLPEQKRIAAILDAADAYRQKTKALIARYDALTQSLFLDMFGDLRKYPSQAMSEATDFIDYRGKSPNKVESGIPLLTAKNVKAGFISEEPREFIPTDEYSSWMVRGFPKTGDVLFTTEAPLGQAALLPDYEKVAIAQRLICLQPKEGLNSNYLLHLILSPLFQNELNKRATGSTAKGIRSKELAKIQIPIPALVTQEEFNKAVLSIEIQKEQAQASLAKAENLFNSLLQQAFKGELTGTKEEVIV